MPNGEQVKEGTESTDWQSPDDHEDDSDNSGGSEEVDSPPSSEHRSKQSQDPAGGRGKAAPPSTQVQKRTRTSSPEPTEKAAKKLKTAPQSVRRPYPRSRWMFPSLLRKCFAFSLAFASFGNFYVTVDSFSRLTE